MAFKSVQEAPKNRKSETTRSTVCCPIFETSPAPLSGLVLPTYEDVLRFCQFLRYEKKTTGQEPPFADIAKDVAQRLIEIWSQTFIPIVSDKRIVQMLQAYHSKYLNLMKSFKQRQDNTTFKAQIKQFKLHGTRTLFDIASCKCDLTKFSDNCFCKCNIKECPGSVKFKLVDLSLKCCIMLPLFETFQQIDVF